MKSKKSIISILITIIIAILIICTMFIVRNLMTKDKIESKIKLSKDEKNSLNYEQLIEDIKSVEDGHGVKYAKKKEKQTTDNKIVDIINAGNDLINSNGDLYIGDGYTISYFIGGELIQYEFYTNDSKLIYSVKEYVPLESIQEHNERTMEENKPNIIFYGGVGGIIILAIVICVVIYRKSGKVDKNG